MQNKQPIIYIYLLYGIIWWKCYAGEFPVIIATRCKAGSSTTNLHTTPGVILNLAVKCILIHSGFPLFY